MKPKRVLVLMHETLVPPDDSSTCTPEQLAECRTEYDVVQQLRSSGHEVRCLGLGDNLPELTATLSQFKPQVAFNLAEEFQGVVSFDQHLVAYLELLRQPYTGCNPRGLTLSRDKALAKRVLMAHGIATPRFMEIPRSRRVTAHDLRYPLFVKSVTDDASFGIARDSLVSNLQELRDRVAFIHKHNGAAALVEEFVIGRELYVGVIGNQRPMCYPVWEMEFGSSMPDGRHIATRRAKWDRSYRQRHGIHSHVAQLSAALARRLQLQAIAAYRALSLSGYARMDFRLNDQGECFLLEANANPCLTASEDFAQSAQHAGEDYAALLEHIVKNALSYRVPGT